MRWRALGLVGVAAAAAACSGGGSSSLQRTTTTPGSAGTTETTVTTSDGGSPTVAPSSAAPVDADVTISIDAAAPGAPISPLILGVSSTLTAEELRSAGLQLNSWGGNPSTRYNFEIGHAWNHGADYEFRNTNYGSLG